MQLYYQDFYRCGEIGDFVLLVSHYNQITQCIVTHMHTDHHSYSFIVL